MVITGAFFCDAANVTHGGTLNVLGGVWDWIEIADVESGDPRQLTVVVLFEVEPADEMPMPMTIEARDPSGAKIVSGRAEIHVQAGSTHGFVIVPIAIRFQITGRHVVEFASQSGLPYVLGLEARQAQRP